MNVDEVRARAFSMPIANPAYPKPPYRFYRREFIVIRYRTDPDAIKAVVPAPLIAPEPVVNYEFIRMPDSTGFGDYTETGQVIPVRHGDEVGGYVHSMYLNDEAPIAGGREIWGFPKKLASPAITHESDTVVGTLHYGSALCALGSMGYKHVELPPEKILASLRQPNFVLKIIPNADGKPRICELVRYYQEDIELLGAWSGPAALALYPHVAADVAKLPVLEVLGASHFIANLTLGLGEVVFDYLKP